MRSPCAASAAFAAPGDGTRETPAARGIRPVNIDACDGAVQQPVAYTSGSAVPLAASCATAGVLPAGAPYGSNASRRPASKMTSSTFGGTGASVVGARI